MIFQRREYQSIAVDAIFNYFMYNTGNPVIAMPTGSGKSVVIADFLQRVLTNWPNQRVLILTHVKELIEQNAKKMLEIWPTAPIGIYSAGLKSRQAYMPITFGGVASVVKAIAAFGHIDLLLIDECHLLNPNTSSMYQVIIEQLKAINPYLKVVGFTATWWRSGQGALTEASTEEGKRAIFTDIAINMTDMVSFNWFIEQGYLLPLIPKRTNAKVDVTGVGITAGEYNKGELETATEKMTYEALIEAMNYAWDRRKWLVFAAGNLNAEHASSIINTLGRSSTYVTDKTKDRTERIRAFKDGFFNTIVCNNILTTGFDDPEIDCIVMLRKTMSTGLWVQMLGRGTRPVYVYGFDTNTQEGRLAAIQASQKQNCLVLDFARNTAELGPINDPKIPGQKVSGGGDAPVKICDTCGCYNHASVRICQHCGAEFPRYTNFMSTASEEELIRTIEPVMEWFNVRDIVYSEQKSKEKGISFLKVTYFCYDDENRSHFFDELIFFEHTGFAKRKAHNWWASRHWSEPPGFVREVIAMQAQLKRPTKIRVWTNKGKYPEVLNYEYE